MNNETRQTAVEWQFEQLFNSFESFINKGLTFDEYFSHNLKVREQAKEREEAQIINAYTQGQYDGDNIREGDAYEYYNLIYGGNI